MNKKVQSDFLFAQPSFAAGVGRNLDLWGRLDEYNRSENGDEADSKAIAADWLVVGQDIQDAIEYHQSKFEAA